MHLQIRTCECQVAFTCWQVVPQIIIICITTGLGGMSAWQSVHSLKLLKMRKQVLPVRKEVLPVRKEVLPLRNEVLAVRTEVLTVRKEAVVAPPHMPQGLAEATRMLEPCVVACCLEPSMEVLFKICTQTCHTRLRGYG